MFILLLTKIVKTNAVDAAMIADPARHKRYAPSALGDEATGKWLLAVPGIVPASSWACAWR